MVEAADAGGRLRAIVDAVRSNRVEDDFSDRWSYAREDFGRKLYHKRNKVRVRFVELTDTIPVQGPETEVEGNLVVGDFLALLDQRERQIVVLLCSGYTKVGEVASILGYKNHSPVSKYLGPDPPPGRRTLRPLTAGSPAPPARGTPREAAIIRVHSRSVVTVRGVNIIRRCLAIMDKLFPEPVLDDRFALIVQVLTDTVAEHGYAQMCNVPGDQQAALPVLPVRGRDLAGQSDHEAPVVIQFRGGGLVPD